MYHTMKKWNQLDRGLILASNSPRRKEILSAMGLSFSVCSPILENEDDYLDAENIEKSIQELSLAKAQSVAGDHASSLVLGSDTIVVIDGKIIGKPIDKSQAREMLTSLSGKKHIVYSGVAVACVESGFVTSMVAQTDVYFRTVADWEIDEYLMHDEYGDKAGAYAIQGKAMSFVEKIEGCFYNVMGLPVNETINICKAYTEFSKGSE